MTNLSVNINKVATLRNAREAIIPMWHAPPFIARSLERRASQCTPARTKDTSDTRT